MQRGTATRPSRPPPRRPTYASPVGRTRDAADPTATEPSPAAARMRAYTLSVASKATRREVSAGLPPSHRPLCSGAGAATNRRGCAAVQRLTHLDAFRDRAHSRVGLACASAASRGSGKKEEPDSPHPIAVCAGLDPSRPHHGRGGRPTGIALTAAPALAAAGCQGMRTRASAHPLVVRTALGRPGHSCRCWTATPSPRSGNGSLQRTDNLQSWRRLRRNWRNAAQPHR